MLGNDLCSILNGIAGLIIGTCLLQHMGSQYVPDAVRTMRQKPFDRASSNVGIIYAIALNDEPPWRIGYKKRSGSSI